MPPARSQWGAALGGAWRRFRDASRRWRGALPKARRATTSGGRQTVKGAQLRGKKRTGIGRLKSNRQRACCLVKTVTVGHAARKRAVLASERI